MTAAFNIPIPEDAAAALAAVESALGRLAEFDKIDARLTGDAKNAEKQAAELRGRLASLEADAELAEVVGERDNAKKLTGEAAALRKQLAGADEAAERPARIRSGLAGRRSAEDEAIAAALPALRRAVAEIRQRAMTALYGLFADDLAAAALAAIMLNQTIGAPSGDFLDQIRLPSPLVPMVELPQIGFTGSLPPAGVDPVQGRWLLRVRGGELLTPGLNGEGYQRRGWRDDAALVRVANELRPYVTALKQAEAAARRAEDARHRAQLAAQRERMLEAQRTAPRSFVTTRVSGGGASAELR